MVWCKQLVMAINRYLFDIVDINTMQISENPQLLMAKARQYFEANRSMTLKPDIVRPDVILPADAFWYEDNRRIYQIKRPDIDKVTFLMIRLAKFPQNRFVAIETVNVNDKDWIFGCNAAFTHNTYRHCKQATSLSELSRWSGSANESERRKLATVDLHALKQAYPGWSHVVVRVSPTKKPVSKIYSFTNIVNPLDVWMDVGISRTV
ncbi:PREDICTED: GPI inositol-deacylase [Papilio polytes]|uniref:GPI inositol-deacylase n=1 Tax=Papilio polytes TaxID=76194 RepID=UPI0006761065|nr:PREDICTED: GPI inositol-deacylase [Papilio polytes]